MGPGRKICIVLSGTKTTKAVFKRLNTGIVTNSSSRAKQLMTKCDLKVARLDFLRGIPLFVANLYLLLVVHVHMKLENNVSE